MCDTPAPETITVSSCVPKRPQCHPNSRRYQTQWDTSMSRHHTCSATVNQAARGNCAILEHELQPRLTCERRRGPTSGASLLPIRKPGWTKTRSIVESPEGLEKESSDKAKATTAKNDLWSGVCWEMVRNKKPLMAIHVLMMVVTYCRPRELLQSMREDLIRPMYGVASDWSLLLHPVQRGVRRHDRLEKPNLSLDHQKGCSPGGRPSLRKDFRVPIRGLHHRRALGLKDIVPYQCRHSGASLDKAGQQPHHGGDQKTGKLEVRQLHCTIRRIWKTGNQS